MIPNTYVCPLSIIQIDVLNVDDLKSDAAKSVCYKKFLTISPAITVCTCTASMVWFVQGCSEYCLVRFVLCIVLSDLAASL